jgi:cytochrome c biogenesis protein
MSDQTRTVTSRDDPAATTPDPAATTGGASTPPAPPTAPPALSPRELGRWAWRQLTSMRTALVLLFLLALGAIPGSIVPQRDVDSLATARWIDQHPTLAPIYDTLGLFSVYDSVWFSAVYLLLMVSLVGCIVPRLGVYWRGLRARPPQPPRHLARLPQARSFETCTEPEAVLEQARTVLRRRRYRVDPHDQALAAERGYLREAGNLLFHLCLLVVLVGFAVGNLYGYKGGVIVVSGQTFSNSLSQYDDFVPGSLFGAEDLEPFSFTVKDFDARFLRTGPKAGQPIDFSAKLRYRERPDQPARSYDLAVNHPLELDGGSVYLVGHGYAPRVTVRDGQGEVAYSGPVVFLPQDATFESFGVIKAPDALPEGLGFEGLFLPTYGFTMARGPFSQFPQPLDPVLSLLPYHGDLGVDSGEPQSVYELDKDQLKVFTKKDGKPARLDLAVGQTKQLPGGAGSLTFDGVDRWVKLQISDQPGTGLALGGVVLAILGLLASLFVRPRRAWVRVRRERGRTVVELAGLDRSSGGDLGEEIDEIERRLRSGTTPTSPPVPDHRDPSDREST